ncbi:MAG: hypothetical protein LAT82_05495 [Nanoarchaeota archaeon]|nr:hypothetical protein [Nanoarchaeota archaeon]
MSEIITLNDVMKELKEIKLEIKELKSQKELELKEDYDTSENYLKELDSRVVAFEKNNDYTSKSVEELKKDLGVE